MSELTGQQRSRKNYLARKSALQSRGICTDCGSNPLQSKILCSECLAKNRKKKAERIASGLCPFCTNPRDKATKLCSACQETKKRSNAAYIERRTKNGQCIACGTSEEIVVSTTKTRPHCKACFFKRTAHNSTGIWSLGQVLSQLFEQQSGRCAYTGRILELGVNASLDHKRPRSRYPELLADPKNLQWVDASINSMKHDMTHEGFVSICCDVARHQCQ